MDDTGLPTVLVTYDELQAILNSPESAGKIWTVSVAVELGTFTVDEDSFQEQESLSAVTVPVDTVEKKVPKVSVKSETFKPNKSGRLLLGRLRNKRGKLCSPAEKAREIRRALKKSGEFYGMPKLRDSREDAGYINYFYEFPPWLLPYYRC